VSEAPARPARTDTPVAQWPRLRRVGKLLPLVAAEARTGIERLRDATSMARAGTMPNIGRLSGAGLVLLTTSAVLWLSTLLPLRQSVEQLRDDVARLETAARSGGSSATGSLAGQARTFLRQLPTRTELPGLLTVVVSQASAAGLELERGEYQFLPAKTGRINRYRLAFPVRGTYAQVRTFVDSTLAALPAVALEELKLEREDIGDEQLQADLHFAVMVRNE
jgi:hypothetical protein